MLEIYDKVRKVPDEAKKTIGGGKLKGMTDINPMWRIKMLTDLFGVCGFGWYYIVTDKWIENCGDETCAFVDIDLYIKMGDEWSRPIHGTGGSKLVAIERDKPTASDECYKMATTDALSVACKQLGMGADVYWDKDRTKYSTYAEEKKAEPKPEPDKISPKQTGFPSTEEMLKFAKDRYPEGSKPFEALKETWKIETLDQASTPQLMGIWSKYH